MNFALIISILLWAYADSDIGSTCSLKNVSWSWFRQWSLKNIAAYAYIVNQGPHFQNIILFGIKVLIFLK